MAPPKRGPIVSRPETREETRSLPAREVTMALWAPETHGLNGKVFFFFFKGRRRFRFGTCELWRKRERGEGRGGDALGGRGTKIEKWKRKKRKKRGSEELIRRSRCHALNPVQRGGVGRSKKKKMKEKRGEETLFFCFPISRSPLLPLSSLPFRASSSYRERDKMKRRERRKRVSKKRKRFSSSKRFAFPLSSLFQLTRGRRTTRCRSPQTAPHTEGASS